jgi:hypothetical protein
MKKALWDPNHNIEIAKDKEKKQDLFIRKRWESETDRQIDLVFSKLYDFYEYSIIDKARVIFGSNLIELRYSNNPFCPNDHSLGEFLSLEVENQYDFKICEEMDESAIKQCLLALKDLRFQKHEYLEAFRLNSYSGNVWAYFCSSSSLICDYSEFLQYRQIRCTQKVSHEHALEQLNPGDHYFLGDREFVDKTATQHRMESEIDNNIDLLIELTLSMFKAKQIFEIQFYMGSGVIRVLTPSDPYTSFAFLGIQELYKASMNYQLKPMTLEQSLKNRNFNRPDLRASKNSVNQAFHVAKMHRLTDENLYLRVFYIDFIYNKVLSSFSCGGTRYQSTQSFIDDYQKLQCS